MKIIDLLNKIANKEKLPETIKYNNTYYYLQDDLYQFYMDDNKAELMKKIDSTHDLNDEIEIIEDTPKKIEELPDKTNDKGRINGLYWSKVERKLLHKINELVQAVNSLKEKE